MAVRFDQASNVNICAAEFNPLPVRRVAVPVSFRIDFMNMRDEPAAHDAPIIVWRRTVAVHHGVKLVPEVQQLWPTSWGAASSIFANSAMVAFNANSIE